MTWFVMRDLTRANANYPAWKELTESGYEVYTPMTWKIRTSGGHKKRKYVPVMHDLLFVNSTREALDPFVASHSRLQYRFVRGGRFGEAMTVNEAEMERFIKATSTDSDTLYYAPSDLNPSMIGKKVRIVGGMLDGFIGNLLSIKGMRKRRLIVGLSGMITAAVEVNPDYIEIIK